MRIIRVEHGGTSYYGILEDGLVFRLHQQPGHMEPIPLSEAKVLPLVTPSKVVCVGLNYKAHAEELGYPLPNMPSFFLKPPSSIIGNGEPIVLPSGMGRIEHEAELAMVVGKVCRNLTPEEAERLAYLRKVFPSLLLTGPFSIILGFNGGLMALNDRLKLRSMVVAEKDDRVFIASEEAAIRTMEPEAENVWAPMGGEPVIVRVKEGMY